MNYDPDDRKVALRQVLAGWTLCLAMVGLAFAATGRHHAIPNVSASSLPTPPPLRAARFCSARLPVFTSDAANTPRQRPGHVVACNPVQLQTSVDSV